MSILFFNALYSPPDKDAGEETKSKEKESHIEDDQPLAEKEEANPEVNKEENPPEEDQPLAEESRPEEDQPPAEKKEEKEGN